MLNPQASPEPSVPDFGEFEGEPFPFDYDDWFELFQKLCDGHDIDDPAVCEPVFKSCFTRYDEYVDEQFEDVFTLPLVGEQLRLAIKIFEWLENYFSRRLIEHIRIFAFGFEGRLSHKLLAELIAKAEILTKQHYTAIRDQVQKASDPQRSSTATEEASSESSGQSSPTITRAIHQSNQPDVLQPAFNLAFEDLPRGISLERKVRFKQIWKNLTISRDQTSASDLRIEHLSVLRASTQHHHNHQNPLAYSEPKVSLATDTEFLTKFPQPVHLPSNQNYRQIKSQAVGLDEIRETMASHAMAKVEKTTSPWEDYSLANEGCRETKLPANVQDLVAMTAKHTNYTELIDRISSLEVENKNLKIANETAAQIQNLYWIQGTGPGRAYLAEPTWSVGPDGEAVLTAHFPITDVNGFLSGKHNISFVVSQYYNKKDQEKEVKAAVQANQPLPRPKHHHESIFLKSSGMIDAVEAFFAMQPKFAEEFPGLDIRAHLPAPYLFWYHYRSSDVSSKLNPYHQHQIRLLTSWIDANYAAIYDLVDAQLEDGVVSIDAMPFLVKPSDVLVWEAKGGPHAIIAKSWPTRNNLETRARDYMGYMDWTKELEPAFRSVSTWKVDSWSYDYDGRFSQKERSVDIVLKSKNPGDKVPIQNLSAYPLKFAKPRLAAILEKRGRTFWRCRERNFVSYNDERDTNGGGERYMVDFETYKQLHSDSGNYQRMYPDSDDPKPRCIGPEEMAADDPPPAPQIYVFPNTIPGYNMRSKKWIDLNVDHIEDITWNKQSFDHLVVDNVTKELVQALVMHQIARGKGTDIIERKGNGLIMLLHGGPGTGKTFTAESVAELAEKPLFRITCGDIGTEPEKVEKYLESALYLGKVWDCVVLIDEAEVFLEQRSLDNLGRNALVSVFLRVLEYYEGILILTSNRVGTFDEAFKSRILLSLHYDNLTLGQRTKIWKNFFSRLKAMGLESSAKAGSSTSIASRESGGSRKCKFEEAETGIDFDDVECYLGELAAFELNGRQIRNVITAARQYANFKGVALNHEHLKHVIAVSSKFENYLKKVQEGYTGDEIMRSEGVR